MKRRVLVRLQADERGVLRVELPGCEPGTFYQIELTVTPESPPKQKTPEELGHSSELLGLAGSITDPTFERPPQGTADPVPEF
jgi:hypothetical protein